MAATGKVTQVIGSTFDAEFPEDQLPKIYNAIRVDVKADGASVNLVGEVQQHLGGGKVRAVALGVHRWSSPWGRCDRHRIAGDGASGKRNTRPCVQSVG